MKREELIAHAVETLCSSADRDRGRRLALVCSSEGWRVGWHIPRYHEPWSLGDRPACWIVLDWLGDTDAQGHEVPYLFAGLAEAYAVASELRVVISARVSAVAPAHAEPGELVITIEDPARDWTLTVESTAASQWRWGVCDPDGVEIAGGGGYETEDEAREEGEAELAVWSRPAAVAIVV